jgi:DNA primase
MPELSPAERKSLASRMLEYHEQLLSPSGSDQLDYLVSARGLSLATIERFLLGAVVRPDASDDMYRGRISIPYLTAAGPVCMRFRDVTGEARTKYLQPKGSDISIFNVHQFTVPSSWIVVCEGEIDTMTACQAGLPAVGIPGVSNWMDHYAVIFEGYEKVMILADNDDKGQGQKFAEKVAEQVPGPAIRLLPDSHDVNSFTVEHGPQALLEHLKVRL